MKYKEFSMPRAYRLLPGLAATCLWLIAVQNGFAQTTTTTTLGSTSPVSNLGAAVTLTATVTDNQSNPVTAGTVGFFDA